MMKDVHLVRGNASEVAPPTSLRARSVGWLLVSFGLGCAAAAAQPGTIEIDRGIDWETRTDPRLELEPPVRVWNVDMRPVWGAALRHSDSDLRREIADSITQAHRLGMPGLAELRDDLRRVLESSDELVVTKTAVAAALVELDIRDLAPLLADQAAEGPLSLQQIVEPALARWDYEPAREIWLGRIGDRTADPELVRLAAVSLAEVRETQAAEPLAELLLSPISPPTVRLAAARSLARLDPPDLLRWSDRLFSGVSSDASFDRQLGVELLTKQSSSEAIELLERYAEQPSPSVAAVALRRLLELDPSRVLARADEAISNRDANVRQITLEALATDSTPSSIQWLAHALDDRVPDLRREARRSLLRHAIQDAARPVVIERTEEAFQTESWRAIEQSIIVLTELEQRYITDRLLDLIHHSRAEVMTAAAWGLKHLSVPDDAEVVLAAAQRLTEEVGASPMPHRAMVQAHLYEALGLLQHRPAVELLRQLIPKNASNYPTTRAAAIWTLGLLLEHPGDAEIVRALEARLADTESIPPEDNDVRAAAAVALGRVADPDSLEELRRWAEIEHPNSNVGRSCRWAVTQMTGESFPDVEPSEREVSDWPLMPFNERP